jgi:hypothetical protein
VKVEVEDTIETFLGSRVHEALEKLYRNLQFEQVLTLDGVLAFFNRQWERNWDDSIIIVNKDFTQNNYRKMGERYLKDYYQRYKPFSEGKILGLETTDTLSLDKDGNYGFYIRIDRLMDMGNGFYEVHDYKTNMTLPRQEDLDRDRQLAMYSLWVREQFKDFKKVRLVWHFVAFDKEMESYRSKEQLEKLRAQVLEDIREIETAQDFPAKVSRLCNWCLYKGICPEWKHEVQIQDKPVNEFLGDPGVRLVDEYVRVKSELDARKKEVEEKLAKLKKALIAHCESEGITTVFGTEKKISVKKYESFKFPLKGTEERAALESYLTDIGRLWDLSELDVRSLAGVLKDREWDSSELSKLREFATKESGHRLSIAKHERPKE